MGGLLGVFAEDPDTPVGHTAEVAEPRCPVLVRVKRPVVDVIFQERVDIVLGDDG